MSKVTELFHPQIQQWFERRFQNPTEVQTRAWPVIQNGHNILVAAPTGSGKTLTAFLSAINRLFLERLSRTSLCSENLVHPVHPQNRLGEHVQVLYISPLKALANDIHLNLQVPLREIQGAGDGPIRVAVRTGDTPAAERARMRRIPPHILATTPESLYILLTSQGGRALLQQVQTVIVDEIHALVGNKRGAHLALSLERLDQLCLDAQGRTPQRIGLSATQRPMDAVAHFLVGQNRPCEIVDTGHLRQVDLQLELLGSPMEAVMANEAWAEIYNRLAELAQEHQTTLIFVNTRRLAERAARHLADRLGEHAVTAHHGSLAKEHRLSAEQRLKSGQLRALVATASLELGIDIGDIDLVCQLGSPRSVSALLQRVGRSGHSVGRTPKGRLFPLSRDELLECVALIDALHSGQLDRLQPVDASLDVLAQQIIAETGCREWTVEDLFNCIRRAWPYRDLSAEKFEQVLTMLAQGYTTRRGRHGAYIHYDRVNGICRGRKGSVLTAVSNGGAIPDQFDYDVILLPAAHFVGSLNEDFAFESLPGDIFQLGNTSYRIHKIEHGKVFVEDAKGQPPNIPFWFGEAPGRSDVLSQAVSQLRAESAQALPLGQAHAQDWFGKRYRVDAQVSAQCMDYLGMTLAMLGVIPNQKQIVAERFFDETGDMHLVIHAPFGTRINRAFGLALRKRFCRQFNFELQAAALEDSVILSLGPTHSFSLEEVAHYLHPNTVGKVLVQALLDAPVFETRWRWNATTALAIKRMFNGKRRPAQWQRNDAQDLVALIFPDQLACLENIQGDRDIPDHPLVEQTLYDCTHVAMDLPGLEKMLQALHAGEIEWIGRELPQPSPMAQEIINARPYAFLDDAPAEERRTLAIQSRHLLDIDDAAHLAGLDPQAIALVKTQAWPVVGNAEELHDALVLLGFATQQEMQQHGWECYKDTLIRQNRLSCCRLSEGSYWITADRLHEWLALHSAAPLQPVLSPLFDLPAMEVALRELVRSRLECGGLLTAEQLRELLQVSPAAISAVLAALEHEGFAIRGRFLGNGEQWCARRLLARMNRYTVKALRKEIEPVAAADYMRFLLHWQQLSERGEGPEALQWAVQQLEGYAIAAAAWEKIILPGRVRLYLPHELDRFCTGGVLQWMRLGSGQGKNATPLRNTPIVLVQRAHVDYWRQFARRQELHLSAKAQKIYRLLQQKGALFLDDLVRSSAMLPVEVQQALAECAANGLVSSDDYAGLRDIITPKDKSRRAYSGRRLQAAFAVHTGGRWLALNDDTTPVAHDANQQAVSAIAMTLLRRYGIVLRKLLEKEDHIPPWRELLYAYRRLEARGDIRGGRFIEGFSGEQFALPEALSELRRLRRVGASGQWLVVSAVDPVNLTGVILPGEKIAAVMTNKILMHDAQPVAVQNGKSFRLLQDVPGMQEWDLKTLFLKTAGSREARKSVPPYAH